MLSWSTLSSYLSRISFSACLALLFPLFTRQFVIAQAVPHPAAVVSTDVRVPHEVTGDAPADPGPLATNLSPKLKSPAIRDAMKKVANWQLSVAEPRFNRLWTYAALYDGLLAASKTTGDPAYRDAVVRYAEQQHWQLNIDRFPHADDLALAKAYLDIYLSESPEQRKPEQIAATKAFLDRMIARTDDPAKDLWWWSDALYMAPPVLANMYKITGNRKYLDFMDHEWSITTQHLYDPTEHLYFRDAGYLHQTQANGRKLFWSRGNGWVFGGLVMVLDVLPAEDPLRPKYVQLLRDMSDAVAAVQGSDGLWRTGLLDPGAYALPENSGSAFFTYGIAYGINEHILDRKKFEPIVEKAWAGLLTHVYANGRLGSIQPVGAAPGKFTASDSHIFGVGGFLLAGSELDRMAGGKH